MDDLLSLELALLHSIGPCIGDLLCCMSCTALDYITCCC
jgi:hypothetical protein